MIIQVWVAGNESAVSGYISENPSNRGNGQADHSKMLTEMEGGFLLSRGWPGSILSDDGLGTPPARYQGALSFSYGIRLCLLEDLSQCSYHICGKSPNYL